MQNNIEINLKTEQRYCLPGTNFLGYVGECNCNRLVFKFVDGFIDGIAKLHTKDGYYELYKADEQYILPINKTMLTEPKTVTFQLEIETEDGKIYRYDEFAMIIKPSINGQAEIELPNVLISEQIDDLLNNMSVISDGDNLIIELPSDYDIVFQRNESDELLVNEAYENVTFVNNNNELEMIVDGKI